MTQAPIEIGPSGEEGDDLIAGEYVLGTLPLAAREAAAARRRTDPAFAARIRAWEGYFEALNVEYVAAPTPPDLLPRVEKRLFGTPGREQGRHFVRMILILSAGVVAALALILFTLAQTGSLTPPPAQYAATLEHRDMALTFALDWNAGSDVMRVRRTSGGPAPAGQVYALWLIHPGRAPVLIGALHGPSVTVAVPKIGQGAEFGISLEPAGRTPGAGPAGPMLVLGLLEPL